MSLDPEKVFSTSDLDLAAYLMLQGLKYLECKISHDEIRGRPIAMVRLQDEKRNARDLERLFMTSPEKQYRGLNKYLLKEAHNAVRRYTDKIDLDGRE